MAAEELYRNYCDLVCEGGGVKGIGLAGAFSVLEEHEFRHVDVRHVGPNTTKSSVRDPAIWIY